MKIKICVFVASFLILFFASKNNIALAQSKTSETVNQAANRYAQLLYYINSYYLEDLEFKEIVDEAIKSSVEKLDPHSSFITAEDLDEMNEPLQANFTGVGIEFAIIKDTLTIQSVIQGGPSHRVGLLAGDKIIQVDNENIAGISLKNEKVRSLFRGEKGSLVYLSVLRRGSAKLLNFTITRDIIPIESLDASYEAAPGILYLKLSRFAATSYDEIKEAMDTYVSSNSLKGIILDLRGNGGGYLGIAIQIANEFLSQGNLIVYTEGRSTKRTNEYANGFGAYSKGPLCILVDENSASASEIVSGAIQDHDRGIIIGRRTFGKGLVQRAFPLADGSQVRLTIARYHTPSGRVIQSPYEEGNKTEYYRNFLKRYESSEFFNKDSISFPDSLKFKTIRTHRTVYGGGGIMPDIFIAKDTSSVSPFYVELLRNGVIPKFVNVLVDRHRSEWKQSFPTFEEFIISNIIDDKLLTELLEFTKKESIKILDADVDKSGADILNYVKALIASSIYGHENFYKVINSYNNKEYEKAIEVINNWDSKALEYSLYN